MSNTNQYGLTRDIPLPVKREVRQRCGFGCVICGTAIVQYEHIEPTFAHARSHQADGITLLCPTHHAEVTNGLRSKESVIQASADPRCLQTGFSSFFFEPNHRFPNIFLGTSTFGGSSEPIVIHGFPIFTIEEPVQQGSPYRISAEFRNFLGQLSAVIKQNEWLAHSGEWDVELTGARLTIRESKGNISLQLLFRPGEGITIERLKMFVNGAFVEIDLEGDITVTQNGMSTTISGFFGSVGSSDIQGFKYGE